MIRIALCDDEPQILDEVSLYLKKYGEACKDQRLEIFPFTTLPSLMNALEDGRSFDIFVLDIYIGDEMGTELARSIRKMGIESPIMFLTSSVEHAPESFETGTLRYLIKPLKPEKLYEAMDVAVEHARRLNEKLIMLKADHGSEHVNVSHILFSEAHAHYQYLTLNDGSQLRTRITVTDLFEMIGDTGNFIRCGSAYIVNLRKIKKISPDSIVMINGKIIPVPRGSYSDLKRAFWKFHYEGQEE